MRWRSGISFAATAIVARRIGEKDLERAAQAAGLIVLLGVTLSAAIGPVLSYFASDIFPAHGCQRRIVALGTDSRWPHYARLQCDGVHDLFDQHRIFCRAGDAVLAMRTLWLANALNIVLGPFFIFGWGPFPELGVTGAAVATNIGRGVGVLYQLWHLAGFHSRVQVRFRSSEAGAARPADHHGHREHRHRTAIDRHHELGRSDSRSSQHSVARHWPAIRSPYES